PALARVCSASGDGANPFSDLCMATNNTYDSVRAAFATNCFNREVGSTDSTDCSVEAFSITRVGDDTLCGNGSDIAGMTPDHADCATSRSVQFCANAPFSTDCKGNDIFDNTREALLGACTNGVSDEKDLLCGQNGGFSTNEITCINNPFTADSTTPGEEINCGTLFTALGDANTLKTAQDNLIAACTGADADGTNTLCSAGRTGAEVAACLANPFGATCATELGATQATTAKDNVIALCMTGDALTTNTICTEIPAGTTKDCISDPFGATCETDLGTSTQATAQNNIISLCASDAITTNGFCMGLTGDVKTCLDDPFTADVTSGINCGTTLSTAVRDNLQSDLIALCTGADANGANARCTTAATMTTCLTNPFDATTDLCSTQLGTALLATAQSNLIALCTGTDASVAMNTLCTSIPAGATKDCITNPFGNTCETTLGANAQTTAQANLIEICSGDGADGTNARCTIAGAAELTGCLRDPFIRDCDTTLGATQAMTAQRNILTLCTAEGSDAL
ncbi:MAG: hypothetical protein K8953_04850, partial [Proteobacteria bacterium]|nr:hypothetical protein [Pseudomonadota bacterium]